MAIDSPEVLRFVGISRVPQTAATRFEYFTVLQTFDHHIAPRKTQQMAVKWQKTVESKKMLKKICSERVDLVTMNQLHYGRR